MKYTLSFLCTCAVLLTASFAFGQSSRLLIDEFQVGKFVSDVQSTMKIPSVGVGIVGAERNYFFETYGPTGHEEPFLIGPLSQSVTAMAVMLLVHEGKIALDEPAAKWISIPTKMVTIADLLSHKSGLSEADGVFAWENQEAALEELVGHFSWDNERVRQYSSANYQLLAAVVEKASKQPFGDFVHERIFEPAGMSTAHAGLAPPTSHVESHQYIFGFSRARQTSPYAALAVGSDFMWMSSRDMERWLRLFINGGKVDKKQVIPREVIDALIDVNRAHPTEVVHEMGWTMRDDDGIKIARHSGFSNTSSATMILVPERNIGIFVVTNVNSWRGNAADSIGDGLLGSVLERGGGQLTNFEFVARFAVGIFLFLAILAFILELYRWLAAGRPMKLDSRAASHVFMVAGLAIGIPTGLLIYFAINPLWLLVVAPDVGFGALAMIILQPTRWLLRGFNQTVMRRVDDLVQKFA